MYLRDSFSWCKKDETPESKHQLHFQNTYEPHNHEIKDWLLGKLYSRVLIEPGADGLLRSVDYGRGEQKKNQVWEFLDYHSSKYNGSRLGFNADVRLVLSLLKSNPSIKYIATSQIESVDSFVGAWLLSKVDTDPQLSTPKVESQKTQIADKEKNHEQKKEPNGNLKQLFSDEKEFDEIMQILANKELIDKDSLKWKDTKNGAKGLCFALIRDINDKGYLQDDVKMNKELCRAIAWQTFGFTIGLRTFHNAKLSPNEKGIIPQRKTPKESD